MLAIVAGFALGVLLHRLPRLRRALDPLLASYYAVPTFVFYPLFIVLFGLNRWPLVAIGFMFAVVAMAINTLTGSRACRACSCGRRRSCGFRAARRFCTSSCRPRAPYLFTGAKLAIAYSFIGVIAGEFVLAGAGIGHAIAFAYNNFDNPTMYGLMILLIRDCRHDQHDPAGPGSSGSMHGAADVEPMAVDARDGARRKTALADIAVLTGRDDPAVAGSAAGASAMR